MCWQSLGKYKLRLSLAPEIAGIVYHKVGTLVAQRILPVLRSVSEFTNKREGRPSKAGFFVPSHKQDTPKTPSVHKVYRL